MTLKSFFLSSGSILVFALASAAVALPLNLRHDAFGDIFCP